MTKKINLFVRFFILLLVGCHTPPIDSEQTAIELEEPRIDLIADGQALITLERLNTDTSPSIWEQYFIQRGGEAIWNILRQREQNLQLNFESLITPPLPIRKPENEIVAGLVQYLVFYPIKSLKLGWDRISNNINKLTPPFTDLVALSSLEMLNLTNNDLEELPDGIDKLTNLKDLSISVNNFSVFSPNLFKMTNLEMLDLSTNNFTVIPTEVGQLSKLERLDLADNKLYLLPAEVGRLTKLKELNLSFNLLTILPSEIGCLTKLECLDLSNNLLIDLPREISKLLSLKHLDIFQNQLKKLPSSMVPQFNKLLSNSRNKISGNLWLTTRDLRPTNKDILKSQAYQLFPHSLLTLCMEYVEKYIEKHQDQQEDIEKKLPYDLSQAEIKRKLKAKSLFTIGKNIIFFKRIHFKIIPFYLDYPLSTYEDINNMIKDMGHKRLYQVIDSID